MGLFEQFPYTNLHELNLGWLLEKYKQVETNTENIERLQAIVDGYLSDDRLRQAVDSVLRTMTADGDLAALLSTIFAGHVNVMDFGAAGDGSTDDAAAIQAAFDSVTIIQYLSNTTEYGYTGLPVIEFPAGVFAIGTGLDLPMDCWVKGSGENGTQIKAIAVMDYMLNLIPGNHLVTPAYVETKRCRVSDLAFYGQYNANYGLTNHPQTCWIENGVFENLYFTQFNLSGFYIESCWLSRFTNIRSECAAIPIVFCANSNSNGFNNNVLENICANNFPLIGIFLEAQNCIVNGVNIDRGYDYKRTPLETASYTINGVNYTEKCGLYITGITDTLQISELWEEWMYNGTPCPGVIVENIKKFPNGRFYSHTVEIRNTHLGTQNMTVFAIRSGDVVLDGLHATLTLAGHQVIDTTGADNYTSLLVKSFLASAVTESTITLPYGAMKWEDLISTNGWRYDKQDMYNQSFMYNDNTTAFKRYNSAADTYDDYIGNERPFRVRKSNGLVMINRHLFQFNGSDADANGYFDLGFTLGAGRFGGYFCARNADAQAAVNTSHWVQMTTLGNGHTGVRMTTGTSTPVTLTSSGLYMFVLEFNSTT